jgi:hypothetical protein
MKTCNPRPWEAEAGGYQVQGQPELLSETPPQKNTKTKIELCVFMPVIPASRVVQVEGSQFKAGHSKSGRPNLKTLKAKSLVNGPNGSMLI